MQSHRVRTDYKENFTQSAVKAKPRYVKLRFYGVSDITRKSVFGGAEDLKQNKDRP